LVQVEVRLYATLRRQAPPDAVTGVFSVTVGDGSTVIDLLRTIQIDPAEVHMIMVNGIGVTFEQVISEGDRVGLFPPVGGG
jgi:molybdopterin converting factor small subunit